MAIFTNNLKRDIKDGLVGHWSFSEDSGLAVIDYSGNGNHGGMTATSTRMNGLIGKSFVGNATNTSVTVQHSDSINLTQTLTISAWVKRYSAHDGGIMEKTIAGAVNESFLLYVASTNIPVFRVMKSNANRDSSGSALPLNRWIHLVGVYDGANGRLWINGIAQALSGGAAAPIDSGTGTLLIGALGSNVFKHNGELCDVRLYNRALSSEEINALYRSGASKIGLI